MRRGALPETSVCNMLALCQVRSCSCGHALFRVEGWHADVQPCGITVAAPPRALLIGLHARHASVPTGPSSGRPCTWCAHRRQCKLGWKHATRCLQLEARTLRITADGWHGATSTAGAAQLTAAAGGGGGAGGTKSAWCGCASAGSVAAACAGCVCDERFRISGDLEQLIVWVRRKTWSACIVTQ